MLLFCAVGQSNYVKVIVVCRFGTDKLENAGIRERLTYF